MVDLGQLLPIHTQEEPVPEALAFFVLGIAYFVSYELANADLLEGSEEVFTEKVIHFLLHVFLCLTDFFLFARFV